MLTAKMKKLKRCPFCMADAACLSNAKELEDCRHFEDEDKCPAMKWEEECKSVCVVCDVSKGGCGASSGYATSIEKAIAKWNVRNELTTETIDLDRL